MDWTKQVEILGKACDITVASRKILESIPVLWALEASSLEVKHCSTSILYDDIWCIKHMYMCSLYIIACCLSIFILSVINYKYMFAVSLWIIWCSEKNKVFLESSAIVGLNRSVLQNVLICWSIWYCTRYRNQVVLCLVYRCQNTTQLPAYSSWWRRQQWNWYSWFLPFPLPFSSLFPRIIQHHQ